MQHQQQRQMVARRAIALAHHPTLQYWSVFSLLALLSSGISAPFFTALIAVSWHEAPAPTFPIMGLALAVTLHLVAAFGTIVARTSTTVFQLVYALALILASLFVIAYGSLILMLMAPLPSHFLASSPAPWLGLMVPWTILVLPGTILVLSIMHITRKEK